MVSVQQVTTKIPPAFDGNSYRCSCGGSSACPQGIDFFRRVGRMRVLRERLGAARMDLLDPPVGSDDPEFQLGNCPVRQLPWWEPPELTKDRRRIRAR